MHLIQISLSTVVKSFNNQLSKPWKRTHTHKQPNNDDKLWRISYMYTVVIARWRHHPPVHIQNTATHQAEKIHPLQHTHDETTPHIHCIKPYYRRTHLAAHTCN